MSAALARGWRWAQQPFVKRGAKYAIVTLVILLVGRALWSNWSAVSAAHWRITPWLLVAGFGLLVLQEISYGLIWQLTLRRLGYPLPVITSIRLYLTAEFLRYIPGNVWHVLARVQLAEQQGIPRAQGFASMTIELATKLAAAALIFILAIPFWGDLARLGGETGHLGGIAIAVVGVPLLIAGMRPRVLEGLLNVGARLLKRQPITIALTYRDILAITAAWLGSWTIAGLGCWLALRGLNLAPLGLASVPLVIGINALGWDIGFLSFITPSGLGFREGAVAALLALGALVPDLTVAGVVAILIARLLPTLAEIGCVGAAYIVGKMRPGHA